MNRRELMGGVLCGAGAVVLGQEGVGVVSNEARHLLAGLLLAPTSEPSGAYAGAHGGFHDVMDPDGQVAYKEQLKFSPCWQCQARSTDACLPVGTPNRPGGGKCPVQGPYQEKPRWLAETTVGDNQLPIGTKYYIVTAIGCGWWRVRAYGDRMARILNSQGFAT